MDPAPALTEPTGRRTTTRSGTGSADATVQRPDPGGRTEAELKRLCDGLLGRLESDRARVVGVLADDVVSVITMARYLIEDATQRLERGELRSASEALENASARIRDAAREVVSLCSDLRPRLLDDLGLLPALSWLLREFNRENRSTFVSPRITVTEGDVPAELKLPLFRIVQAALSNVARHSKASAARVFLSLFEDELRLGIEDNGVGFDVEGRGFPRNAAGGLGLIGRWVEGTGGRCSLEATARHGAKVQVFWRVQGYGRRPQDVETESPPARASA